MRVRVSLHTNPYKIPHKPESWSVCLAYANVRNLHSPSVLLLLNTASAVPFRTIRPDNTLNRIAW